VTASPAASDSQSLNATPASPGLGTTGVDRQPGLAFLVATFEHRLSRDGDPQLHDHEVVANVVEAADGRRAALDGSLLYRWQKAADAVYLAALRAELTRRLGVRWTVRQGVWEIEHPCYVCRLWSKRRAAIEAELAERAPPAVAPPSRRPCNPQTQSHRRHPRASQRLLDEARDAGFDITRSSR
jgi:conjugative relaxase-like TrwC/TraI family protein